MNNKAKPTTSNYKRRTAQRHTYMVQNINLKRETKRREKTGEEERGRILTKDALVLMPPASLTSPTLSASLRCSYCGLDVTLSGSCCRSKYHISYRSPDVFFYEKNEIQKKNQKKTRY